VTSQMRPVRPVHPLLTAVLPVLLIYSGNVGETAFGTVIRPTAVMLIGSLLLWALLALALKSIAKGAVLVSLCIVFFFSFGACAQVTRMRVVLAAMALGVAGAAYLLVRTRSRLADLTGVLNTVTLCIAAVVTVNLIRQSPVGLSRPPEATPLTLPGRQLENSPDIYYIILDGYGGADVLESVYGFDNTEFLDQLRERGFRVCERSRANYTNTSRSLPSSLNMDYIDELAQEVGGDSTDGAFRVQMLSDNRVVRSLRSSNYLFASFASGFDLTESLSNVDLWFRPGRSLNDLEMVLLPMTPIPAIDRQLPDRVRYSILDPYRYRREVILYALDHLAEPRAASQPVFVFAHIICPHPPFVFGPEGTPVDPPRLFSLGDAGGDFFKIGGTRDEYLRGYRDHLTFLNHRLIDAVDSILSAAPEPPIIVLQGDHGPALNSSLPATDRDRLVERQSILNAYLLPNEVSSQLYDDITPVNTFRLILNYLGITDYQLLEDRCYARESRSGDRLIDVTEDVLGP